MRMKRILGVLLILGALALGYAGYTKLEDSGAEVQIGDLEISAQDKGSQQNAYVFFGLGAVCLIAGLMLSRGKS